MDSSSHDLGAELRMHSFTINCDTFSNEEKVVVVFPVTSVGVACSEAMLAPCSRPSDLVNGFDEIVFQEFPLVVIMCPGSLSVF